MSGVSAHGAKPESRGALDTAAAAGKRAEVAPRDARPPEPKAGDPRLAPRDPGVVRATPTPPSPRSVSEARDRIESTRERLATTAELLKQRVELERTRMEHRLDVASRLRSAIAGKELWALGAAFVGGLALAWLRRRARLDEEDRRVLRAWDEDRERVLAALGLLEED